MSKRQSIEQIQLPFWRKEVLHQCWFVGTLKSYRSFAKLL